MTKKISKRAVAYMLIFAMLLTFLPNQLAKAGEIKDYDAMSISDILESDEELTWVFAGDSITHNATFTAGMNGYGEWFEQYLNASGRDEDSVIISAWGGADIYDFQTKENTPLGSGTYDYPGMGLENFVTKYNPDVVFIKIGMNDRYKTTEEYTKYYNMMLDSIYSICKSEYGKVPKIILLTPTPTAAESVYDDMNAASTVEENWDSTLRHCNTVKAIAKERGLISVDLREAFMDEQLRLGDDYFATFFRDPSDGGIHPNAAGQYLMFNKLAETLGLDTTSDKVKQIFGYEYEDFLAGELFTDLTSDVIYTNIYDTVIEADAVSNVKLLASIDFTSKNGTFAGSSDYDSAKHIDLTDADICDDPLTLEEAQSLTNEFSVVFRARLDSSSNTSQPVLLIGQTESNWNNALALGVPGKSSNNNAILYYAVRQNSKNMKNGSANSYNVETGKNSTIDGEWHDFAVVQEKDKLVYYMDGEVFYTSTDAYVKSGFNIGSLVSNDNFVAMIGSYTQTSKSYSINGNMDYYQLYKGALTAEQVKKLADESGKFETVISSDEAEMNKTMPDALTTGKNTIASVDFTSSNGVFTGATSGSAYANSTRVDLTDGTVCKDALTLSEVQALTDEFSVVFRAKLDGTKKDTQAILYISDDADDWDSALVMHAPGKKESVYFEIRNASKKEMTTTATNTFSVQNNGSSSVGEWHTIAIVQESSQLVYYIDGTAVYTDAAIHMSSGFKIGSLFTSLTEESGFTAYIGSVCKAQQTTFNLNASMDWYQLYGSALTAEEVAELSAARNAQNEMDAVMPKLDIKDAEEYKSAYKWIDVAGEKTAYSWLVAGGEQLMGNDGAEVNRSLYRLIDNAIRRTPTHRGTRLVDVASKDFTIAGLLADYDENVETYNPHAFMLLPEISWVYADGYVHSTAAVNDFKTAVQTWLAKNKANNIISVLWTPLAAADETINGYISDYADAIRDLVKTNDVLFFDANRFMNENMEENTNLARNWFKNESSLTALGARDVAYAFCMTSNLTRIADDKCEDELGQHDLRVTTDSCVFKGEYVRDNILSAVTAAGTSVTIDISAIKAVYPNAENFSFAVLPYAGASTYNEDLYKVEAAAAGNAYTFTAPCSDPVIAVFAEVNGTKYRFADVTADVTTDDVRNPQADPDGAYLDSLEVVGAPDIEFNKNTKTYDITLYSYQRFVQILADAQDGLTITVDGKTVTSGENSGLITVDSEKTVEVTVSGRVNGKDASTTYTLNMTRPDYPDIIITEVMTDAEYITGNGGDDYEMVEIYNTTDRELNLKDYSLGHAKDYRYTAISSLAEYPTFYFTGDNQIFGASAERSHSYTGINQITKYSTYWEGGLDEEPDYIAFPAHSTMVIWVKFLDKTMTYDTLINDLKAAGEKYTLYVDGQPVVPDKEQLVVAEVPAELSSTISKNNAVSQHAALKPASAVSDHFYLANWTGEVDQKSNWYVRGWLFILGADAVRDDNASITEAGNDIISAGKFIKLTTTNKLSTIFYYDTVRGMSIVKDETVWDTDYETGHTSDQQGYANKTSFGAIEYWQKPYELADTIKPGMTNNTPSKVVTGSNASIDLTLTDNNDVRYMELYVRKAGENDWTKITKDFVLLAGMENKGVSADQKEVSFTYELGELTGAVEYYGFVVDGNNNRYEFGSAADSLKIAVSDAPIVSFVTNGAGDVASVTVKDFVLSEEELPDLEKEDHTFTGWYTDAECTKKAEFPLTVTKDTTLYAKWEKNEPVTPPAKEEEILSKIESAEQGAMIEIDVKDENGKLTTVITKEILESVKEKEIQLVLDMGAYKWTINGKNITASKLGDIDLGVTIDANAVDKELVDKLANGDKTIQISLAHNGEFGFEAVLHLDLGAENTGKYANLYHYVNGKLVFMNAGAIDEEGNAKFDFSNASDYVIVIGADRNANEIKPKGDFSLTIPYMILFAGGIAIAGAVCLKRKKSK